MMNRSHVMHQKKCTLLSQHFDIKPTMKALPMAYQTKEPSWNMRALRLKMWWDNDACRHLTKLRSSRFNYFALMTQVYGQLMGHITRYKE